MTSQLAQAPQKTKPAARINWSFTDIVIYRRVSTSEQGDSGLGLDAQLTQCQAVCDRLGLNVVGDYVEVCSGTIAPTDRPVLSEAIAQCQAKGARLLVAKVDRFSRNLYDVIGFCDKRSHGANTPDLMNAESPAASPLEVRIRAVVAQEERDMISKRTSAAIKAKQANEPGYKHGAVGAAKSAAKKRAATEGAIARAVELRAAGLGYKRIADTLNTEGFTTSTGGQWYAMGIRSRLLTIA
jgi:DNA invertase Pin-like site-specific DNA recombinase